MFLRSFKVRAHEGRTCGRIGSGWTSLRRVFQIWRVAESETPMKFATNRPLRQPGSHQPTKEGVRSPGTASRNRSADAGVARRTDDACADRDHASLEPSHRAGV